MMWLLHVPCCPFFNQHPFFNQMTGKIFYAINEQVRDFA